MNIEYQLSYEQLSDLENRIRDELTDILNNLNNSGRINELLDLIAFVPYNNTKPLKYGNILVIGAENIKRQIFNEVIKEFGFKEERFIHKTYQEMKNFHGEIYSYSLILAGPMPHSGPLKGKASGILTELKNDPDAPKIIELKSNNKLRVTKTNIHSALRQATDEGIIAA